MGLVPCVYLPEDVPRNVMRFTSAAAAAVAPAVALAAASRRVFISMGAGISIVSVRECCGEIHTW